MILAGPHVSTVSLSQFPFIPTPPHFRRWILLASHRLPVLPLFGRAAMAWACDRADRRIGCCCYALSCERLLTPFIHAARKEIWRVRYEGHCDGDPHADHLGECQTVDSHNRPHTPPSAPLLSLPSLIPPSATIDSEN